MMDRFGMSDLRQLTEAREGPCVTICMPTHVAGADGQQDALRLKNLAVEVESQLADGWMRAPEARDLMAAVRNLPADRDFWDHRSEGLALFLDKSSLRRFRVPMRLDELVLVNRRFHVKPLLPLLTRGDRFLVLALSQQNVRLFEASEFHVEPLDVPELPQRMDVALNLDGADRGSQMHFAMKGGKGKQSSVFHGQGGINDSHKDDLSQFFRMIDAALAPFLRDEQAPLVLAGVDYLLPIYRKVCRYPHLADVELAGNSDYLSGKQIHAKVWPLVQPLLVAARRQTLARYRQLAGTGKTSDDIRQALPAAVEGRIESLFVASNRQVWGVCDAQGGGVAIHDDRQTEDDDLLNAVAVQSLLRGGVVYAVEADELPEVDAPLAAVMRY